MPITNSPTRVKRRFLMDQYIGIDVAKETFSVYDGKREFICKNTRGCAELKGHLGQKALKDIVLIFEATGPYSRYLREFCAHQSIRVWIVNPIKSASFTKTLGNRSKTDTIDARMLYELRKVIKPENVLIPRIDREAEQLSLYFTSYELIIKTRTAVSNHLHALAHTPDAPVDLVHMLTKEFQTIKETEMGLLQQMEDYVKNNPDMRDDYESLRKIKGIGRVSAISLLILFRTYPDTSRTQITALVGLDPTRTESGTSVKGRRKISKGGSSTVRKVLYFPTLNCIQHNPVIKAYYERLVSNHKPPKVAVIAAMRKLLLIAHAVYKSKTVYYEAG
jgi:transposase